MHLPLIQELQRIAMERLPKDDLSHDLWHAVRLLNNVRRIAETEHGDLNILVPAALFHELVNPPKNSPEVRFGPDMSAKEAGKILSTVSDYPQRLVFEVEQCIRECSFTNGVRPSSIESAILQDGDLLESVGSMAIMRTFASSSKLQRMFYHPSDPYCVTRRPEPNLYAVDLFFDRLLLIKKRLNTPTARELAKSRERYLYGFLKQLGEEIGVPYVSVT